MSSSPPSATTTAPFRGGLVYIHPDHAHLLPSALSMTAVPTHVYPVPVHRVPTPTATGSEPRAYDTRPGSGHRGNPRSVREFVRTMRMPKSRPSVLTTTRTQGLAAQAPLAPTPQTESSTDYTTHVISLLKDQQAQTGSKTKIHFSPDSQMLNDLTASFEKKTPLPHIGRDEPVPDDEKALLAKLTLSYNEGWSAAQEEPLYYELQQQAMLLMGFVRQINRILWHYGHADEYEIYLVITSPSEINPDFKLCVRPRTSPDATSSADRAKVSREDPPDAILVIEYKRSAVAGGSRMDTLLEHLVVGEGIDVELADSGDRLLWSRVNPDGTKTEIRGTGGAHKALLQVFFQAHQHRSPWTAILAGPRSIMCRLDGPLNMAVSTRSMSGAEPDDYQATLPKSVIALAFDRAINPIHPASSALFLNIKAILEQEQQAEKKRKEELQEMASNKRAKATVDTATANPDDQPKSGPEMPPPPVPSKKAQNPERRRSDSKREPVVGMAFIPDIPMPDPKPMDVLKGEETGMTVIQLDSSPIWLEGREPGSVTLGVPVKPKLLARGRYYDVYEAFIPSLEAKRILDIGRDAMVKPVQEGLSHAAPPTRGPNSPGSSSPAGPHSSSPARAASRSSTKRGRESLDSDISEPSSNMSKSFHSSGSGTSTKVDPEEGVQLLPVVLKVCAPATMHTRWQADWEGAPITPDECAEAAEAAISTETRLYKEQLYPLQGALVPRYLGTWTVRSGLEGMQPGVVVYATVLERLGDQVLDDELHGDDDFFHVEKAQAAEVLNLLHVQAGITHGDVEARHFRTLYLPGPLDPPNLIAWKSLPRPSLFVPAADIRIIDFDKACAADEDAQEEEATAFCEAMNLPSGWGAKWRRSQ